MSDRILLEDLAFYGYHGVRDEEKTLGQRFFVDLALELDLRPSGQTDNLSQTLDYGECYRIVRGLVEGTSLNTIEAVAEAVAAALLDRFQSLRAVTVRVKKPHAPIAGAHFGTVAVEVRRGRTEVRHD